MSWNKASKPVFDDRLQQLQAGAAVNAVNVSEVLAKLVNRGMPQAAAEEAFKALYLAVTPFEPEMALGSAQFTGKGISLGDRYFLASCAHGPGWTSDHQLREVAERCGIPHLNFFRRDSHKKASK